MLDRYSVAIRWRGFCFFLAGLIIVLFNILTSPTAQAEGSRSLYPASYPTTCGTGSGQGCRANLDIQPGNKYVNRVNRLTFIYVYAEANEYILVGSSNRTASNTGIIRIYNPQSFGVTGDETVPGTANFTCSTGTNGLIDTRVKELAGPRSVNGSGNTTGYIPCSYQAPSTGIYGVVFSTGGGGGPDGAINPIPPATTISSSNNSVAAWDVTVRSSDQNSTTDLNGRVFTYAWAGYTGDNNHPIYSTLYYITQDGYRYQQTQRGLDPAGFALYANSLGFFDNGQPLFKDLRGTNALVQNIINGAGLNTQIAQYPIFFSDVSPSGLSNTQVEKVLVALNIPLVPPSPTVSSAIHYTDLDSEGGSLHLKGAIKRHTVKNDGDGGDELGGGGTGGSGFG